MTELLEKKSESKGRATVVDVAREAGLSITTVSRALNGHPYVSEEYRQRVLAATRKLGYTVNWAGRSLRKGSLRLIGYLTLQIHPNPFFSYMGSVLEGEARGRGFTVVTTVTHGEAEMEMEAVRLCVERGVDGVLWAYPRSKKPVDFLLDHDIPVVLLERPQEMPGTTRILVDNLTGSRAAAKHLIDLGHRRVGFVGPVSGGEYVEEERMGGFLTEMKEAGLEIPMEYIKLGTYEPESSYQMTKELLSMSSRPSAIFCSGGFSVAGVMRAISELNVLVPQNLSVVCIDDGTADYFFPQLTHVHIPTDEIARTGFNMLHDQIETKERKSMTVKVESHLVVRESTARIN